MPDQYNSRNFSEYDSPEKALKTILEVDISLNALIAQKLASDVNNRI